MVQKYTKWSLNQLKELISQIRSSTEHLEGEERVKALLSSQPSDAVAGHTVRFGIERVVRIIGALVHDIKPRALRDRDATKLLHEAYGNLLVIEKGLTKEALEKLQQDLYRNYGQWQRAGGNHLSASWFHEIATRYSHKTQRPGEMEFIRCQRLLRQGFASLAIRDLEKLQKSHKDSESEFSLARSVDLLLAHSFRMMARRDDADAILKELLTKSDLSEPLRDDAIWEQLSLGVSRSRDPEAVIHAVRKGNSHVDRPGYWLEAYLWSRIFPSKDKKFRLASPYTRYRDNPTGMSVHGLLYQGAKVIDELHQSGGDAPRVYIEMGDIFAGLRELVSIDKELLLLAAFARSCIDFKNHSMAEILVAHYRSKSLILSDGASRDVLNVGHA